MQFPDHDPFLDDDDLRLRRLDTADSVIRAAIALIAAASCIFAWVLLYVFVRWAVS